MKPYLAAAVVVMAVCAGAAPAWAPPRGDYYEAHSGPGAIGGGGGDYRNDIRNGSPVVFGHVPGSAPEVSPRNCRGCRRSPQSVPNAGGDHRTDRNQAANNTSNPPGRR